MVRPLHCGGGPLQCGEGSVGGESVGLLVRRLRGSSLPIPAFPTPTPAPSLLDPLLPSPSCADLAQTVKPPSVGLDVLYSVLCVVLGYNAWAERSALQAAQEEQARMLDEDAGRGGEGGDGGRKP